MNNWELLKKELSYYNIKLIDNRKCQLIINDKIKTQSILKTIRQINKSIRVQKNNLFSLWGKVIELLEKKEERDDLIDNKMVDLFVFSLKDLSKFLLCFEDMDNSVFSLKIEEALNKDISEFCRCQIYELPDYKITIDWVHRLICRGLYIIKLLSFAMLGEERIGKFEIKTARGVSGPWSRLDLPMLERVFPFNNEIENRTRAKQKQRRYTKGFENYNSGNFSSGHYWRELRNEPFSWENRNFDDPYPGRHLLNR